MPCIIIRTNVEIPSDRAKELKTALAVSWEKVPTKRERWLMIVMEDKQQMLGIQKERIFVAHDVCPSWGWVDDPDPRAYGPAPV